MDEQDNAPLNVCPFHLKGKYCPAVAFKLNIALAPAEIWHLKGCKIKVKHVGTL
jgi:hypothetical protein